MKYRTIKYLFLCLVFYCAIPISVYSQDKNIPKELYTAAGIPDSLKEDANSVVRYASDEVTVTGAGKAVVKHYSLVTILNEKGDKEADLGLPYNRKFDTFSDIVMRVYDANGNQIKKYHKSDAYDGAIISEDVLYSDDRFLRIAHTVTSYPTTIEVEYEQTLTSFFNPPTWYIQVPEQAVQNEFYKVIVKPEMGFKYKCKNINLKPDQSQADGSNTYSWIIKNLKAFKLEERAADWRVEPKIVFAVNKFDFYGYPGDISSWQNYGSWVYSLNKDVCTLSPQRVTEIKKMTDTIKTDKGKAKFLYEYLQHNMRYVSVNLGIGGFKPFDANFVDQKKYGDCKALANYMHALLSAVNIPSYWAVIFRGENGEPADVDFPLNTFNHEILCIPFKNDTTWLECTGNTQPFGKLDITTQNRNALLITDKGGELVNTPKSTGQDNQFNSNVELKLDSDGSAKAVVKILCSGVYRDDYVEYMPTMKYDEQKEFLMRLLNIKQASTFDYTAGADNNGVKEVELNLDYDKFCDIITADKQFYRPNVFDLCAITLPFENKRKSDYYFDTPLQKTCITTIDLPKGFEIEALPTNQTLKFSYGSYDIKYVYDAAKNEVISTAKFNLTDHVIPAAKYNELQQYLDAVAKAQNKKLVIRKKA